MSKKEKIVVVGAGISGITASIIEAKKGNDVFLIDSNNDAGGLFKSIELDGDFYDYGTHFISETGIKDLDEFFSTGWKVLKITHKELNERLTPTSEIHSEWMVVAEKM